jgi:DNA modification methylase
MAARKTAAAKDKAAPPRKPNKMAHSIVLVDPETLVPYAKNARTHSQEQVREIAASIESFGFTNPILVSKRKILAGHGRLAAARLLGLKEVPVIDLSYMSDVMQRAYILADNRLAEKAGWDEELLAEELDALQRENFDIELTGFTDEDLKRLMEDITPDAGEDPGSGDSDGSGLGEDEYEALAKWAPERGQVWQIGPHRLLVGDSTDKEAVKLLMGGQKAALVFTDPPYGVSYEAPSGEHKIIKGDKLRDDGLLEKLLVPAIRNCVLNASDDAGFYIWHAMSTRADFEEACKRAGLVELDTIVWVKPGASLGMMDYRRDFEPCLYMAKDGEKPRFFGDRKNTTTWRLAHALGNEAGAALGKQGLLLLGGDGRQMYIAPAEPKGMKKVRRVRMGDKPAITVTTGGEDSNAWEVGRASGYQHPTEKPTALAARAIRNSSQIGGVVLDLFLGSGSTMAAAEEEGRICYGAELDLLHAARILERMSNMGLKPHITTK